MAQIEITPRDLNSEMVNLNYIEFRRLAEIFLLIRDLASLCMVYYAMLCNAMLCYAILLAYVCVPSVCPLPIPSRTFEQVILIS
jgi:hypothetical protein